MSDTNTIISPNMNLPLPIPGQDPGPDYANNQNATGLLIDAHNHTSGNGVQIPVAGLNIQSALPMNNNSLIGTSAIIFQSQTSLSTIGALYTIANELWYNDNTQPIKITSAGSVNATSSGISSGTATASFTAGVLVVNSATLTPANIQGGSLLLGLNVSNTNYLTLSPPSALSGGAYTLVLPTIPSSTQFLTLDTSGNIGTTSNISASQIASQSISGSQLANQTVTATQIANQTVTATQIANNTVTSGQIADHTIGSLQQIANYSDSGNNNGVSTSPSFVLVGAVTITTNGGPVKIEMVPVGGSIGTNSGFSVDGGVPVMEILVLRNGSGISSSLIGGSFSGLTYFPPSSGNTLDLGVINAPGTYAYEMLIRLVSGSGTAALTNCVLDAWERA